MSEAVLSRAGSAVRWRAMQLAGIQAIYFVRLLVLAALLAPEAFGLLAIASIALSTLMRVSDVGMIPALVQRQDASREQYDAAWTVGLTRALLVTTALVLAAPLIATLFSEPRATGVIQVLALRPTLEALASIGIARLTRDLRFRELAFIYMPGAVVDLFVAVITAPTLGVWALVLGTLAGSATMAALSYVLAPHRPRVRFNWSEIVPLVDFGRWVLAIGIVTLVGTLLVQLAVSRMLGATALGMFFLAVKLAFLPVDAANSVVGAVAFPMFAQTRTDPAASSSLFTTVFTGMHLLLLPVYALMFVLMPQLETVLGEQWLGTGHVVRVLCVASVAGIAGTVLGRYLMGQGDARGAFLIETVSTVVTLVVLLPCIALLQVDGAAMSWLLGGVATLALSAWWLGRVLPGVLRASGRRLAASVLVALVAALAAWITTTRLTGMTALVSGGLAGVVAGALVLWWQNSVLDLRLGEFGTLLRKRRERTD